VRLCPTRAGSAHVLTENGYGVCAARCGLTRATAGTREGFREGLCDCSRDGQLSVSALGAAVLSQLVRARAHCWRKCWASTCSTHSVVTPRIAHWALTWSPSLPRYRCCVTKSAVRGGIPTSGEHTTADAGVANRGAREHRLSPPPAGSSTHTHAFGKQRCVVWSHTAKCYWGS
jgi:hypothetical protein